MSELTFLSNTFFPQKRWYLRRYQVKHYRHEGETHLQLLRLNCGWVFTTRNVSQGVKNVTCKAHPRAHVRLRDHRCLGSTSCGLSTNGIAKGNNLQIKEVGRSCVVLFPTLDITTESCDLWGQDGYKTDLSSGNLK